jgi:penicillin amidase
MAFVFRWLFRLAAGLIALTLVVFGLTYYFAARSLPDYNGTYVVTGITAPVEIVRDNANVPHIFGTTDDDVFFALGYAHAQDRMWQMTMLRRTAQGRLSELYGPATLKTDELMRRFDLYPISVRSVAAQDADGKAALEAYAKGVNAWLAEVNKGARGRGAPEMWMFNHPISPWQPADSIAILKLMAVQSSTHIQNEVLRARTSLIIDPDRVIDILPDDPGALMPEYAQVVPGVTQYAADTTLPQHPLSPVRAPVFAGASNAWAAGPSRSATGSTLLASDPHMPLSAPTIWYLARLELESGGVIGGTIPGLPVVMAGRSADLGWGMTASYADDQDVYIEEVNSNDSTLYRYDDEWIPFETRDSIINVKDGVSVTLRLRWTKNGPVLPPDQYNLGTITPPGHVPSIAWTALSDQDASLSALIALMQATTVDDAIDATTGYVAPSQNLTVADRNTVGMKTIGALPARNAAHQGQGRLPSFGYVATNRWEGLRAYADAPAFVNPESGVIGNTNNKVTDADFPDHISFTWGDTQRIARWSELMGRRGVHTRESFIEMQLDTVSPTARSLLPLIGADLWYTGDPAPDGTPERRRQQALDLLAAWNGEMNEHMPEPLIYAAWLRALQDRLTRDELGPLASAYTHADPIFITRVFQDTGGASAWCDVVQSAPVETCTDISRQALDDGLLWIDETFGNTVQALRWGDAHQAHHDHPVLKDAAVLNWFVNIHQSTSGGDHTLQRGLTKGTGAQPFLNVHAAGYRGVYDFADPDSSVFVTATGQSGHPLSRYYDNLGELWRRGEYIPMSLDPALARAAALGVTLLEPALQ